MDTHAEHESTPAAPPQPVRRWKTLAALMVLALVATGWWGWQQKLAGEAATRALAVQAEQRQAAAAEAELKAAQAQAERTAQQQQQEAAMAQDARLRAAREALQAHIDAEEALARARMAKTPGKR